MLQKDFSSHLLLTENFIFKMSKKEFRRFCETRPTPSWSRRERMEYCALLHDFLFIQDGVKDCGINDDWPEEKPESGGGK